MIATASGSQPEPWPTSIFSRAKAVLFDLDGTLIETHIDFPLMKREVIAAAVLHGVDPEPLAPLDILSAVAAARDQLRARGEAEAGDRLRAECFEILRRIEVEQCATPVIIDGAAEVVARLQALGIPVGVVTRNSRDVSERLLAHAGISVEALVTRDDVARTKPDPMHVFEAMRRLGVPDEHAGRVWMVGDHWMDVRAGYAAGMRTIGVLNGTTDPDRFMPSLPDLTVGETRDILGLLPRTTVRERGEA